MQSPEWGLCWVQVHCLFQQRPKGSELLRLLTWILYWIQRYDSHIMWFPWVPVMLSSVQFSSVTTPFLSLSHSSWTTVLGLFVCFLIFSFFSLCSLYFSASENSTEISLRSEDLSSSLRPSKISSISVTVFLISSLSSCFLLRTSISLLTLSICSCICSTLSVRALNILIICRGPAPVDPGWFEGGDGVSVFGKIHI